MFFDEDGDLAHEFYEEVRLDGASQKTVMKRKLNNLRPQVNPVYFVYSEGVFLDVLFLPMGIIFKLLPIRL